MDNDWFKILVTLGFGVVLLVVAALIVAIANPHLDSQCASKGGQVLHTPGHLDSCIYPAMQK